MSGSTPAATGSARGCIGRRATVTHPLVMAHGLGAVRTMRLDAYAERFCEAGYACLVFDYRNFGDSEGHHANCSISECSCRTGWLRSPTRARCRDRSQSNWPVGHVFWRWPCDRDGGRLPGIAAVVSQCPFTDSVASLGAMSPLISARITASGGARSDRCPARPAPGDGPDRRQAGRGRADERPGRLPRLSGAGARRRASCATRSPRALA